MIKDFLKNAIPDPLIRKLRGIYYGWHGNYSSWEEASLECTGYEADEIFDKVKDSALRIKRGEAVYERDSFLFDQIQYSYPLLASLMAVSASEKGNLHILDFGGALGSTYFQNKALLDLLPDVKWCVVEQESYVTAGIESFQTDTLKFYYTIEECLREQKITAILLSSVLQYLQKPADILGTIIEYKIKYIIIDRTPFISGKDRLTIQRVNPKIYKASYPCWFFSESDFMAGIEKKYELLMKWESLDKANIKSEFLGFLFKIKCLTD